MLVLALGSIAAFGTTAAEAGAVATAGPVCSISQVTRFDVSAGRPFLSGEGTRIVFVSSANPTGTNPGNVPELFLVDTAKGTTTQLTTGFGSNAPHVHYAINTTGTLIAFGSAANFTGENDDGNPEIFVVEADTGRFTQITRTSNGASFFPAIDGDGSRLVFLTNTNLTEPNPEHDTHVVLFDVATGTFTKIATLVRAGLWPVISGDGTRIAFLAWDDLTGENPDGNSELFLFDIRSGILSQVTHSGIGGHAVSDAPSLSFDGTRIAFLSTADLTGENPERDAELFLFDTTTHRFTQLSVGGAGQFSSMDATGTLIAFRALAPSGNIEVYLADTRTATVTQLTTSGFQRHSVWPSVSAAGTRIAFSSSGDLTGDNPNGASQVFLATCGLVNAHVSLTAVESTFKTTAGTTGCPTGAVGTFTFLADLRSLPSSPALTNVRLQVQTLTNGHLLQNADFGPAGIAATLAVPRTGGYTDGVLTAGEAVEVPFVICLQDQSPFRLLVDVLGEVP